MECPAENLLPKFKSHMGVLPRCFLDITIAGTAGLYFLHRVILLSGRPHAVFNIVALFLCILKAIASFFVIHEVVYLLSHSVRRLIPSLEGIS